MPPRKVSAKRERSSSPLTESDEEVQLSKLSKDKKAKVTKPKAEPKFKAEPKPKKEKEVKEVKEKVVKEKKAKVIKWPPPELDVSFHPPRQGHSPIFNFSSPPQNGAIVPESEAKKRPLLVGAHFSMAGGPAAALLRAGLVGANGLALFMKGHRAWKSKDFEPEAIERWHELMKTINYPPESILVHGNYLINLCNPDPVKWDQAYECFKDDIYRCHQLGIKLYNWHPGSTVGACSREESYKLLATAINRVHKDVPDVICVIENMANAGSNIIGTTFKDLSSTIALVEDKSRVKICLDTCHLFAAGFDLRAPEAYNKTMEEFDSVVGMQYLGGIHLNDSKQDLGGCKDLHENIGLGKIGLTGFRALMRDPRMQNLPIILETPTASKSIANTVALELSTESAEISLLYEIQAIEDGDWTEEKEKEITARWREQRDKLQPKEDKKPKMGKGKGKKKNDDDDDDDDDDE